VALAIIYSGRHRNQLATFGHLAVFLGKGLALLCFFLSGLDELLVEFGVFIDGDVLVHNLK